MVLNQQKKKFFFKSHKEPSKKITRQSVVKLSCTYREQFGKYPFQAFLAVPEMESGELALRDRFGKALPLSIYVRVKR